MVNVCEPARPASIIHNVRGYKMSFVTDQVSLGEGDPFEQERADRFRDLLRGRRWLNTLVSRVNEKRSECCNGEQGHRNSPPPIRSGSRSGIACSDSCGLIKRHQTSLAMH